MTEMRTVRGMRDLMGPEMYIRDYLIQTAVDVFKLFGYEPLDSPVIELWETLSAKGGEEIESDTFRFKDKGDREVGLRFDLTVPLARIISSNPTLPKPFKRYAVGKAWRYDRPQAGRYREFTQADVDIIGNTSPAADAEVVMVALEFMNSIFDDEPYLIKINNRKVLRGLTEKAGIPRELAHECFRAIDKLDKIGADGVTEELRERGMKGEQISFLWDNVFGEEQTLSTLNEFREILSGSDIGLEGVDELEMMAEIFSEAEVSDFVEFDLSLARGLDYYTGPVFEGRYLGKPDVGSIAGGGRYDNLIEKFGGPSIGATGISLGVDRIIDILMETGVAEKLKPKLDVFVAPVSKDMHKYAMSVQKKMIRAGFACGVDLMNRPLGRLLEQADDEGAALTVIVGERDLSEDELSIRDMETKKTTQVPKEDIVEYVRNKLKHKKEV
ncbi:MAG: histidine--tRNA ligase [Candidatus Thorarchaeota archaeon]